MSRWLQSPGACGDPKLKVRCLATLLLHRFPSPPPSTQLSGPPVAQPTLRHNGEQSDTGSQRLELAQAAHEQAVKQSKKDRIARFLEEVDSSIAEGDQHLAFKTLKLLQPWKLARRSQLKSKEGNLLGPKQELEALRQYASKVFSAHAPLLPLQGPLPSLDLTNLDQHIHSIKPGKAVPEGAAPAASWRLCSKSVASAMIRHLEGKQAETGLDKGLINADLCLIPKPDKPADKPSNLRPLGILRPDAKGLAGAARESLQPCVMTSLKDIPQFASLRVVAL